MSFAELTLVVQLLQLHIPSHNLRTGLYLALCLHTILCGTKRDLSRTTVEQLLSN